MTWSIIARDPLTGQIGIAVATRFFAVGALVPHIAPRIGGLATQALVNPYYGIDGVKLLRAGKAPHDIIATLIAADDGRESRQLHIMDASGRVAAHTGSECVDWCGHVKGAGFSIAGNMLAGAQVLDVREAWELQPASVRPEGFELLAIPMNTLPARLAEVPADRPVACLCHHGGRSQRVALFLEQQGYGQVANIAGGIDAWSAQRDPGIPRY